MKIEARSALPLLCAIGLMVGLRLVALRSDPYPRLDWSAGLLTDEGFYVHNARNVALFGHARTDEFNNMLLAPLLHAVQTAVFTTFGVGAIQARLISVVCSLLTLALFWAALRRAFDARIALTATLFLGLDHTNLLYNRMALMDTPAALGAVAAFYAFVRGVESRESRVESREQAWLVVCGLLLGLTVLSRMLCAFLLPVPFLALWRTNTIENRKPVPSASSGQALSAAEGSKIENSLALLLPLLLTFALYAALWYWPHRAEIGPMNHYYRTEQIQPKSLAHLRQNAQHALFGDFRGLAPYLFRHTPVLFAFAVIGLLGCWVIGKPKNPITVYLTAWLLLGWLLLAVIGYAPSRYYVTTYPALAAIAAITLWRLPEWWDSLRAADNRARLLRGALIWFLAFHAVLAFVHYGGVLPPVPTKVLLYGVPTAVVLSIEYWVLRRYAQHSILNTQYWIRTALMIWFAINACWLGDWASRLRFTQYETSRWLAENLPPDSVLLGDVAPGLSLDNPLVAVNVIPKLCNGVRPVEAFAGRPRYIVILDGRWKEGYWQTHYPALVVPERRIKFARVLRWTVGVYAVEEAVERKAR